MLFLSHFSQRIFPSWLLFSLVVLLSPTLHAEIEKSPNDKNAYEYFTLQNGLKVLLISDPDGDKAAASMNVAVGSSANPENRPGLAHFLEHMLFLGTRKYPQADEYQSFISSHGGGHNAYTAMENTNYFFDISADNLEPALDRFSQFFISPLFDPKYVDRERHAVHSEYQAKIRDDHRRGYAVTKALMNPQNGHNRFAVGSLKSLSDKEGSHVRDELISFYKRYYSANLMSLVVHGKESLPELKEMVTAKFTAIPNTQAEAYKETTPLFKKNQLPQLVEIQSLKEMRSLTLTLPVPAFRHEWQKKPLYYISSLMGYEGAGSLLSELKNRGWATSLAASPGHDLDDEGTFMVNINLTEEGLKHYLDVSQLFFQYARLMLNEGVQASLYNEEKQISDTRFRFQEKSEPIHMVSSLAQQLQLYPAEKVISAGYTFAEFDPEVIKKYLHALTPDNLLITLKTKSIKGSQTEPHYQTPYNVRSLSAKELQHLATAVPNSSLTIRSNNPFIAEDLSLISSTNATDKPTEILKKEGFTLWHQVDTSFSTPRANLYFSVQRAEVNQSAESWLLNSLYISMVQEQLNEILYDAGLAGLSTQIYPHMKGYSVRLSGYNDKLSALLNPVIQALKQPTFDTERFNIVKQRLAEKLQNSHKDKPYNQTTNKLYELLLPQWSTQSQESALKSIDVTDLQRFVKQLKTPSLKALVHGNLNKEDALTLGSTLAQAFIDKSITTQPDEIQVVQLPKNEPLHEQLTIEHNDSAISVLLQGENNSSQAKAEVSLLSEMLSADFYNELRTEKQLGYIVFATPLQMNKTPAITFIVQSPNTPADALEKHIDSFLLEWRKGLLKTDEETLSRYKQSILSRILKQDNKLSTRTKRYWRELDHNKFNFDSKEQLAEAVKAMSIEQLIRCFDLLQSRRLTVTSFGKPHLSKIPAAKSSTAILAARKSTKRYVPDS
jgi:secreted Zn-dependent insulinase-like peptidase